MVDPAALVRAYYAALDAHEYDRLRDLLDPAFVQRRPDRTFEDREGFVAFMREDRPMTDTRHDLHEVVVDADGERAAVRGRLLDADGDPVFAFSDHFTLADGRIRRLDTYTR